MYFIKPLFFVLFITLFSFMEEKAFSMEEKEDDLRSPSATVTSPSLTQEELEILRQQSSQILVGLLDHPKSSRELLLEASKILKERNIHVFFREKKGAPRTLCEAVLEPTYSFNADYDGDPSHSHLKFQTCQEAFDYLTTKLPGLMKTLFEKQVLSPADLKVFSTLFRKISPPFVLTVPSDGIHPFVHFQFFEDNSLEKILLLFFSLEEFLDLPSCLEPTVCSPINRKEEEAKKTRQNQVDQEHRIFLEQRQKPAFESFSLGNYLHLLRTIFKTIQQAHDIYVRTEKPEEGIPVALRHPALPCALAMACLGQFEMIEERLIAASDKKSTLVPSDTWKNLYTQYAFTAFDVLSANMELFKSSDHTIREAHSKTLYPIQQLYHKMRTILERSGLDSPTIKSIKELGCDLLLEHYSQVYTSLSHSDQGKMPVRAKIEALLKELKQLKTSTAEQTRKKHLQQLDDMESPKSAAFLRTPAAISFAADVSRVTCMEGSLDERSSPADRLLLKIMKEEGNVLPLLSSLEATLQGNFEQLFEKTQFPAFAVHIASRLVKIYNGSQNWEKSSRVLTALSKYAKNHPSFSPIPPDFLMLDVQIAYFQMLLGNVQPMEEFFNIYSQTITENPQKKKTDRDTILKLFKAAVKKAKKGKTQSPDENVGDLGASGFSPAPFLTVLPRVFQFPSVPEDSVTLREQKLQRHLDKEQKRQKAAAAAKFQAVAAEPQAVAAEPQAAAAEPQAAAAAEDPKNFSDIGLKLTTAAKEVDSKIVNGVFGFSRDEYYHYLQTLGCKMRNTGSHAIAQLPTFVMLPNEKYLSAFLEEGENVGGSAVFSKWHGNTVPHYLKKQISEQRERIFNYYKAIHRGANQ